MPMMITNEDFPLLIERYKQTMTYYQGRLCSCVGENNGVPKVDCGCTLGYWYNTSETIIGIRKEVNYKITNSAQGAIFDGGAQFIIPKRYKGVEQKCYKTLGKGDIIVVSNKYRRDRDILRRGIRDKLYAFDITEILSISERDKVFIQGTDYTFEGNEITWIGDEPVDYYSVEFTCSQQYMIWDMGAKDRGTDTKELPRSIMGILRRYAEAQPVNPLDNVNVNEEF